MAALIVLVLLRLERPEDARQRLAAALADYCVVPGGLLAHAAGETVQHPAIEAPGWVGRGAALEFVGELSPLERSSVLEVRLDGRAGYTQPVGNTPRAGLRGFRFEAPQPSVNASVDVSVHGVPLLGSASRIPAEFALDGRTEGSGRYLTGWARIGWSPQ